MLLNSVMDVVAVGYVVVLLKAADVVEQCNGCSCCRICSSCCY